MYTKVLEYLLLNSHNLNLFYIYTKLYSFLFTHKIIVSLEMSSSVRIVNNSVHNLCE